MDANPSMAGRRSREVGSPAWSFNEGRNGTWLDHGNGILPQFEAHVCYLREKHLSGSELGAGVGRSKGWRRPASGMDCQTQKRRLRGLLRGCGISDVSALWVWSSSIVKVCAGQDPWQGVNVLDTARCDIPGDAVARRGYLDSCGVCNGDGSTCIEAAVVILVLMIIASFGLLVVWCKFFFDQVKYDTLVKLAERGTDDFGE